MALDRRRLLRTLGTLGATPLVAGCFDGETADWTATTGGARAAYPGYDWDRLENAGPIPTTIIEMNDLEFVPLVTAVTPDTEVTVVNTDSTAHTFTAPRLGIEADVPGGERTAFTPEAAGAYDYVCELHPPDMLGRLVVTRDVETAPPTVTEAPTETGSSG